MNDYLTLDDETVDLGDASGLTPEEIAQAVRSQTSWGAKVTETGISLIPPPPVSCSIHSLDRGHSITPDDSGGWIYEDTGEICNHDRPCKRCGKPPTVEGYDACLRYLPGIQYACCGHGVTKPVRIYKKWKEIR